jgi:hypothetical protein
MMHALKLRKEKSFAQATLIHLRCNSVGDVRILQEYFFRLLKGADAVPGWIKGIDKAGPLQMMQVLH